MAMTGISVFFPMIVAAFGVESMYISKQPQPCSDPCRFTLVESIPINLTYPSHAPEHPSIFSGWRDLIKSANQSIDIASFYWTLRGDDIHKPDPTAKEGEEIFDALLYAGTHGITIKIAQSLPSEEQPNLDTIELQKQHAAEVRNLNFTRWFGGGVLHTKFWIVDKKHFYIGSANMDWRSLTQVKELGVIVYNCSCLAQDIQKIFDVYWYLGKENASLPSHWPAEWATRYNNYTPAIVNLNSQPAQVYMSSSPSQFCPKGRTPDINAILDVIYSAEEYVHIAVMDYYPMLIYSDPNRFWPVIDDALRRVSIDKGIRVRLLASYWSHSRPDLSRLLLSLAALDGADKADIQVKWFIVPSSKAQRKIPYARVNHNKYMVTDKVAYIGTSNWSGDYFTQTGGVGFITKAAQVNASVETNSTFDLQQQLADVFWRDWDSPYAHNVTNKPHRKGKYSPRPYNNHGYVKH